MVHQVNLQTWRNNKCLLHLNPNKVNLVDLKHTANLPPSPTHNLLPPHQRIKLLQNKKLQRGIDRNGIEERVLLQLLLMPPNRQPQLPPSPLTNLYHSPNILNNKPKLANPNPSLNNNLSQNRHLHKMLHRPPHSPLLTMRPTQLMMSGLLMING